MALFNKDSRSRDRTAAIDGDSLAYNYGAYPSLKLVEKAIRNSINNMLEVTGSKDYIGFIGRGQDTFRHKMYPDYKINRKDKVPPVNMKAIKDMLEGVFGFYCLTDMEAEDGVGIVLSRLGTEKTAICHIDSDLKQLEGLHWDYKKRLLYEVSKKEAMDYYWKMVIVGSSKDHVKGLYRFKKASIDYSSCETEFEYREKALGYYRSHIESAWHRTQDLSKHLPDYKIGGNLEESIILYFVQQTTLQRILTDPLKGGDWNPLTLR